jgi:hypothetical protein
MYSACLVCPISLLIPTIEFVDALCVSRARVCPDSPVLPVLSCPVLSCPGLSWPSLSCPIQSFNYPGTEKCSRWNAGDENTERSDLSTSAVSRHWCAYVITAVFFAALVMTARLPPLAWHSALVVSQVPHVLVRKKLPIGQVNVARNPALVTE